MHGDIASCENDWADLEKSIVEGTFRETSLVTIHLCQSGRVMNRDMIGYDTDEVTIFAMLLLDRLGTLRATALQSKPEWRDLCCNRPRNCSEWREEELIDDVEYELRVEFALAEFFNAYKIGTYIRAKAAHI